MTSPKSSAEAATPFPDQEVSGEFAKTNIPAATDSHSGVRPLPATDIIARLRNVLVEPTITSADYIENKDFKKQVFQEVLNSYIKPAARSIITPDNADYKSGFLNYIYQLYQPQYVGSIGHHTVNLMKAIAERENWKTRDGMVNIYFGVKGLLAPDFVLISPEGKSTFFEE